MWGLLFLALILPNALARDAGVSVWTNRYTNERNALQPRESALNPSTVIAARFGKLFSRRVDGQIYAQPLYVSRPGGGNAVIVATQHNSVYAFDADRASAADPFWRVSLGPSVPSSDFSDHGGPYRDITPEIGILSTPVIDLESDTLFAVAFTRRGGLYRHRLVAIDLATGVINRSLLIDGEVPGGGDGSHGGVLRFDSAHELQRPGLLLSRGVLYIGFGGMADEDPFHGWVFAYDSKSFERLGVYCTTPDGGRGGIWQSGAGLAADEQGNVYAMTGNGSFREGSDFGSSFVKLRLTPEQGLSIVDWFAPFSVEWLNLFDLDLGSSGPVLLPQSSDLIGGGKTGWAYLLDREQLGHFHPFNLGAKQSLKLANSHIHGPPVFWPSSVGAFLYVWSEDDVLKAYRWTGASFSTRPVRSGSIRAGEMGAILSVSSDGERPGSGIVWASRLVGDAGGRHSSGLALLEAFDASDVGRELWNSEMNPADRVGMLAKFSPPLVANGKVYLATLSGELVVYGLK